MLYMKGSCFLLPFLVLLRFISGLICLIRSRLLNYYLYIASVHKVQNLGIYSELKFFAKYCLFN